VILLAGNQGQRLEQLVNRAVAARQHHERLAVLHEDGLADEEASLVAFHDRCGGRRARTSADRRGCGKPDESAAGRADQADLCWVSTCGGL
jgi:hypothetical protein